MRVQRRFLYAGLFLVAIGGVMLTVNLAGVDDSTLRQGLRLWPLAIIALGLGIVVRRSPAGRPAGVLAAVAPGLLLGGAIAAGPRIGFECTDAPAPAMTFQREGTVSPPIAIDVHSGCGATTISTAQGSAWRISAGSTDGVDPDVLEIPEQVSIVSNGRGGRNLLLGDRREVWDVTLPTSPIDDLTINANANDMTVTLPGADIGALALGANASNVRLDATGATIDELYLSADFANLTVVLPATQTLGGVISVNAGNLTLCKPNGASLHVSFNADGPHDVTVDGVSWEADEWKSDDVLEPNQIVLRVDISFGAVEINTTGACA